MANVILVRDSVLLTPRLDRCGVAGVMRAAVLAAAAAAAMAVEERRLEAADLARAQEVFLTSALIGLRPVRGLAGKMLTAGPVTRRLQELLAPQLEMRAQTAGGVHG
jgi:4-amino-4-deoxychorismate lyase